MSMQYAVRQVGDVTVLDLNGRICLGEVLALGSTTATELHELVRKLAAKGSSKILLNLEDVTYVDSSGLGELVTCMASVRNHGGHMMICGARTQVYDMLHITRLASVLDLQVDEPAALQAFAALKKGTSAA